MRLRERDKQTVLLCEMTGMEDDVYTWGEATPIRAAVYPAGERLDPQVCGERIGDMRLMLCDGPAALVPGMRVALEGETPGYRIVSVERWAHQRAVLERIPEGRRGGGAEA